MSKENKQAPQWERIELDYRAGIKSLRQIAWALKKHNPERMQTVLWTPAELVRRVAVLCQPFIPASAAKLLDLLAVPADKREFVHVHADQALLSGTALPVPEGVFPRYVEQPGANA